MRVAVAAPEAIGARDGVQQMALDDLLAESTSSSASPSRTSDQEPDGRLCLRAMATGAYFINASRGELVDEDALLAALDSGRLAGAALDVGRAPDQMPSPALARHPRVIATPHIGGLTLPAIEHQSMETVAQVASLIRGEMPTGAVNASMRPDPALAGVLARAHPRRRTRGDVMTRPGRTRAIATCTSTTSAIRSRRPRPSSRRTRGRRTSRCSASSARRASSSSSRPATATTTAARSKAWPRLGATIARGICVVPPDVAEAELQRLHGLGMRGVRFMMLPGGVLPWSALEPTAARIAPMGWHIGLQLDGRKLPEREAMLAELPGTIVIDHCGKFLEPVSTGERGLRRALPAARARQLLDQALGAVRDLEARRAGLGRRRRDRPRAGEALSRAVPLGEQLAASRTRAPCRRAWRCTNGRAPASTTTRAGRRSSSTTRRRSTASETLRDRRRRARRLGPPGASDERVRRDCTSG